jgi:threonine dehydrogenase-like Zn-dependent dehydrogenase
MPQKGEGLFKYGHSLLTEEEAFFGGLAEYCILKPGTSILKIPPDLPLPLAATVNCAISTVAGALRLAGNVANKNVFIFGTGMLGITCAAMCKDAGANWVGAADISDKRLDSALKFGADEIFKITEGPSTLSRDIRNKFSKNGADIVFDMSGSADAMESGLEILTIGGIAVWVGAVFNTRRVQIDPEKVIRNLITIKGLHNYNFEDFVYALDFIKRNWKCYPFESIVEREFDLADAQQAFEYAIRHKPLRVGVRINTSG